MNITENHELTTDTVRTKTPRSARGSRLLLAGSAVYAAAAVAPFTQGIGVLDATNSAADGSVSAFTSYWGEGAFDFLWTWGGWGWATGNGGMVRYLQAFSVVAMALVAVGALLRLRRGGAQRSIASVVVTAAISLLLVRVWSDVYRTHAGTAALEFDLEAFRFTPSLVVASVGAVVATVGAVMASMRSRSVGG